MLGQAHASQKRFFEAGISCTHFTQKRQHLTSIR